MRPCQLIAMLGAISLTLLASRFGLAQSEADPGPPAEVWTDQPIHEVPIDELKIRLAPLELEQLEGMLEQVMTEVRTVASELAEAMIERARIQQSTEVDAEKLQVAEERTKALLELKNRLVSRANTIVDAVEAKGGDIARSEAYLRAVDALRSEEVVDAPEAEARPERSDEEEVQARVKQLVAIVRAEPPAHERPIPWEVPLAEFELELQPLAMEQILERLGKWREILQLEVRKRIRVDILLNDSKKLERTEELRREAAGLTGTVGADVSIETIKAQLAEKSQQQQRIINAIVDRMEIAIRLVERRGGEARKYSDYIAAATGQKLNITDMSVLRAQAGAWLRSPAGGVSIGLNIARFLAIVLAFWVLSRILGALIRSGVNRVPKASSLLAPVLAGSVRRITFLVGVVIGVTMLGVNPGPLLALIGAAGLVIGLALQGTLSNFASGILILLNRPYDVGDVIDAGGVFGKVEAMNLVSTSILTFDNQVMLVPNNQIWNGVITNVTGRQTRRVDLTFGISYSADIGQAAKILEEILTSHELVLKDPAPIVRVHELADNSVNLIARPWTRTADYWDVYWDLTRQVKERFDAEGIGIPFPQRDLHVPGTIEVKLAAGDEPDDDARHAPVVETRRPPEFATHEPPSAREEEGEGDQ